MSDNTRKGDFNQAPNQNFPSNNYNNNQKNISSDKHNNNLEDLEYEELKNLYMNNIKNFHFKSDRPSKQIFSTVAPANQDNFNNNQNDFLENSENFFVQNNNINNFDPLNNNNQHLSGEFHYEEAINPIANANSNYLSNLSSNNVNYNNNEYVNFSNNINSVDPNLNNVNMNQFGNPNQNYNANINQAIKNGVNNMNIYSVNMINNKNLNNPLSNHDEKSKEKDFKRKKQEEYRKYLDQQLQELNARKKMDKLQHKGLDHPANANKNQINQGGILNFPSENNINKQIKSRQLQMNDFNNNVINKNNLFINDILSPISLNKNMQNFSSNNINKSNMNPAYEHKNIDLISNNVPQTVVNNQEFAFDDNNFQEQLNQINPNLNNQLYQNDFNRNNAYINNNLPVARDEIPISNQIGNIKKQNAFDAVNSNQILPSYNYQDEKKIEKELEKKKKLEYQEELKRQIQEKENKKKQDKQKIKDEDLKFEEKYGGNFDFFAQLNPDNKENNNKDKIQQQRDEVHEHKVMGKKPNFHDRKYNLPEIIKQNQQPIIENQNYYSDNIRERNSGNNDYNNINIINNNRNNPNPNALSREYSEFRNNLMTGNNPNINIPQINPYNNNNKINTNYDFNQGYDENNKFKHSQNHQTISNMNIPYNNFISNANNPYLMGQMGTDQMSPFNLYAQSNMNMGMFNPKTFYPSQPQQPYMIAPFFEEMMKMFFNQQMKIFHDYKETLNKLANERDNMKKENLKNSTLSKLKNQHEKLKSSIGFNPLNNDYNENLENMLENINNKVVRKQSDTENLGGNNYKSNRHNNNYDRNFQQEEEEEENFNEDYNIQNNKEHRNHNNFYNNDNNDNHSNNFLNSDERPLTGVKNQKLIYRNRYYAETANNNQHFNENNIKANNYEDYNNYEQVAGDYNNNNINMQDLYQDNNLNPLDLNYEDFRNKFGDLSQTQTYFNLNPIDKTDRERLDNFNKSIVSRNDMLIDVESKLVKIADKKHTGLDLMETWREDDLMNLSKVANLDKDLDTSKIDKSRMLYKKLLENEKANKEVNNCKNKASVDNNFEERSNNNFNKYDYKNINTDLSTKNLVTEVHVKDKSIDNKMKLTDDSILKFKNNLNQATNSKDKKSNMVNSKPSNTSSKNYNNFNNLNALKNGNNSDIKKSSGSNTSKHNQSNNNYDNDAFNIRSQRENINTDISNKEPNESQEEILEQENLNLNTDNNQIQEFEIIENNIRKRKIPESQLDNFNTHNNLDTDNSQINIANENINKNIYNIDNSNLKNFNFNKTESYIDPNDLQDHTHLFDKSNTNLKNKQEENDYEGYEDQIRFKSHYKNDNLKTNKDNEFENDENEDIYEVESTNKDNYIESTSNLNSIGVRKDRNVNANNKNIPIDKAKKERDRVLNNNQIQEKLQKIKNRNPNSSKNNNFYQSNNLSSKNDGESNIIISDSNSQTMNNYHYNETNNNNFYNYNNNNNNNYSDNSSDNNNPKKKNENETYHNKENLQNKVFTNFQSFDFKKNAKANNNANIKANQNEDENIEYSEEFIDDNHLKESVKPEIIEYDVNLEDYQDIHENQKLQTKLNFFENSVDSTIVKKAQGFISNNVVNSIVLDKKEKESLQTINSNNYKSNPLDRIPRDISSNNIQKLNSIFDKYKGSLNSQNNVKNGNKKNVIEDKNSNNLSKNQQNLFSFEVNQDGNDRLLTDNESQKANKQQKGNKWDPQQNYEDKYIRDRQRNQFNMNLKSNVNKINLQNNEIYEQNQEYSGNNKVNLIKRRNEDQKQNKLNNISSSNVNNYSNLNLVTENSQKNFEINHNRKFNNKNFNDFEDSLA